MAIQPAEPAAERKKELGPDKAARLVLLADKPLSDAKKDELTFFRVFTFREGVDEKDIWSFFDLVYVNLAVEAEKDFYSRFVKTLDGSETVVLVSKKVWSQELLEKLGVAYTVKRIPLKNKKGVFFTREEFLQRVKQVPFGELPVSNSWLKKALNWALSALATVLIKLAK